MTNNEEILRKWERFCCLMPCRIRPQDRDQEIPSRIINVCRGGVLVESDFTFEAGERIVIMASPEIGMERFHINEEISGTVRWGKVDPSSLMGLYYVGIEFDDLLPLKQAAGQFE